VSREIVETEFVSDDMIEVTVDETHLDTIEGDRTLHRRERGRRRRY